MQTNRLMVAMVENGEDRLFGGNIRSHQVPRMLGSLLIFNQFTRRAVSDPMKPASSTRTRATETFMTPLVRSGSPATLHRDATAETRQVMPHTMTTTLTRCGRHCPAPMLIRLQLGPCQPTPQSWSATTSRLVALDRPATAVKRRRSTNVSRSKGSGGCCGYCGRLTSW